ncbi:regulatory protein RecX [Arthrobacter echini]|uniref:regulatory protein RecX n=1 Tax=Arthrobacter echini TaxID=1529066 RepID=UPI0026C69CA0
MPPAAGPGSRSTRRPARARVPGGGAAGTDGQDEGTPRTSEEWAERGRSILLRQLALGPRSRHQLELKLSEREIPADTASALLDRFEEVQLIDDAEYARMWVRSRTALKSLSRSALRRELSEKGIEPDLAEDALLQVTDDDENERAHDVVRRKLRPGADLSDRAVRDRETRRLVGVLARKGYGPGTAFSIVRNVLAETEAGD